MEAFPYMAPSLLEKAIKITPLMLYFRRNNKKFIVTSAQDYTIKKDHIAAALASVTIYLIDTVHGAQHVVQGIDSIYHPGLRMKYNKQNKELSFLRYEGGLTQSPYFDTYHKLDMYFEAFNMED